MSKNKRKPSAKSPTRAASKANLYTEVAKVERKPLSVNPVSSALKNTPKASSEHALTEEPEELGAMEDESYFLGADAALPPGTYGQTIASHMPDPVAQARVLRELQRRVRSTLTPAFPVEDKTLLPGAAMLAGYRHFALRARSLSVDAFGRDPAYCDKALPFLNFLYKQWLSVQLQGLENLPSDGGAILVCNHTGALPYDASMLMHGIAREHPCHLQIRPFLEDQIFRQAFLGVSLRKLGAVRACQENGLRLLSQGHLIAVFPEGRRALFKEASAPEKLQRFGRGGFVRLARKSGVPLVPVAIVPQPARWMPKSIATRMQRLRKVTPRFIPRLLPSIGPWTIQIGKPIDVSRVLKGDDRTFVAEETERIRTLISSMIQEASA